MNLYRTNKIKISKIKRTTKTEKEKAVLKKRGHQQNYFDSPEPIQFSPNGPRFSIEGRKVTYLDWKFDFLVQTSSDLLCLMCGLKSKGLHMNLACRKLHHFTQQETQH